jgi:ribosome recycling factor
MTQFTDVKSVLDDAGHRMDGAVDHLQIEFAGIRTGRANPQLLHNLQVDYYGQMTPLQQLATFAVPEPRMLVVSPYDKSSLDAVEKAIRNGDFGLNPSTDGQIIRCVFPELTEERRKEYIKLAKARAEDARIAVRNVRRDAKDSLQRLVDDGDIGQDEHDRAAKQLEELTGRHVGRIDELLEHKEQDLLEV